MKLKLLIVALFCSVLGWGQGSESFTNSNATASYSTNSFVGDASVTWSYIESRNEDTFGITGKGLMLRRSSSSSRVTSSSVSGGIANFTCELRKAFTGAGNRQVELFVNGISQGTSIAWDNTNVQTFTVNNINISGNVVIEVRNITGNQVVVDNISWTGYLPSSNTITTDIGLTGSPFCVSASTGASVSVPFTSVGAFNAGNVFTAQLSNASGVFPGTVIGTLSASGVDPSGTITATIPAGTTAGTGYRIRVVSSNPVVTGTNNTVDLTVQVPAAITTQPSTTVQNLCQGSAATALSVTATGTSLTYQWYSNTTATTSGGTAVGTSSASYTPVTTATGTLYYYCVVSAVCGASVTSDVSGAVNVTALPATPSGTISAVQNCGNTALTYSAPSASLYWQTSATGTDQTFATTAPYSVTLNGAYYVRAFNGTCWSSGTVSQAVMVVSGVNISAQPTSQSTTVGNTATFTVTATNAASYQWQVSTNGGTTWTNVGTNSNSYTTPATTLAMSGYQYQVVVAGNAPCGTVTSSVATLTVTTGPCLSENFAVNSLPAGWVQTNITFASNRAEFNANTGQLALVSVSNPTSLTFSLSRSSNNTTNKSMLVEVSTTSQTSGFVTVASYTDANTTSAGTTNLTVDLSSYTASSLVYVRFSKTGTTTSYWYLDDINVYCGAPVAGPEINVTGNALTIVDEDTTPTFGDNTNFGTTALSTNIVKSFVIQNLGTTDLTLSLPITLTDVSAPQEFVITQPAVATIPPGGSTTFTITFNSAVAGLFTNTVNINSNDTDEALYNFDIMASATAATGTGTVFNPGELIFVGFDGQVSGSGADDEYLVATLVDMLPGTKFSIVNSRYEAGAAANVRTDKWGGGGDFAEEQPYETKITYNGLAVIPAGSVIRFETNGTGSWFGQVDVTTGTTTTTRTADFSGTVLNGLFNSPNISTNGSDQMYLMQGDFVFDGTVDVGQANYYLNGTLLHGLTNRAAWVLLTSACNGGSTGGNTRQSRLPSALTCFNVESANTSSISGFYENDKQHGLATIRQIVNAVADVTNNWTLGTGRYTIDATSSLTTRAGKTFLIGPSNPAGQWVGNVDTNWFNCANWEGLSVPKLTTDVTVDASALNFASVDYTAAFSNDYGDLAVCNNLTITGSKVEVAGNSNNKLEVYGNLLIDAPSGALDVDDSNAGTPDGQLYLHGNWTNNMGNAAFEEGNGTVIFTGSTPQIINNVTPEGTETFYNVILNNNFTTAISNDLIATGNLTVNPGKTVIVSPDDYIQVNKNLINNGSFTVLNNGSLIQVNDSGVNTGDILYQRTAMARNLDYVYWSSPVVAFNVNNLPNNYRYIWNTTIANTNGGQGNWVAASGNMIAGKGYIARASNGSAAPIATTTSFVGVPNNGVINMPILRGTYQGGDYAGTNGITITRFSDNWNLVGNPYPSSINVEDFLSLNTNIEGAVRIWTHGTLPSSSINNPFYGSYQANYTPDDYITHNGVGTVSGPIGFNGFIAGGQGFMINMLDGAAGSDNLIFNNSLRSKTYNNSQFYRTSNEENSSVNEKNRIWLDLINNSNNAAKRTLVGYVSNATYEKDRLYDAFTSVATTMNLYSIIGSDKMTIQGRQLPFDANDKVNLGYFVPTSGNYSIGIAALDGLFASGQNIYLEDKLLGVIHDLRSNPYSFSANAGEVNNRFVLRYTNETLGGDDFINNSDVLIFSSDLINIQSFNQTIQSVTIHNVLGQLLVNELNVNSDKLEIKSLQKNKAPLIIQVTLENGKKIVKKLIY